MLLEEYVDKGIQFKQLLFLAYAGYEIRIIGGKIRVGTDGKWAGSDGCNLNWNSDSIEDAIRGARKSD